MTTIDAKGERVSVPNARRPSTARRVSHTPKGQLARERVVHAAEKLFAKHGFHGTSLRDVAAAAKQPLASIVYHFAKKEALYAAVLTAIGGQLERALVDTLRDEGTDRVESIARGLVRWSADHPDRVRLLLRELLDNPARVARASKLPLAPVLTRLSSAVAADMQAGRLAATTPEIAVLHLVGAIGYFVVARPTVFRIVGPARARVLDAAWEEEALTFARRTLGRSNPVGDGESRWTERPKRGS